MRQPENSDDEPLFKSRIGDATFSALSKEFPATKSKIGDATLSALSKEFSVWRLRRGDSNSTFKLDGTISQ